MLVWLLACGAPAPSGAPDVEVSDLEVAEEPPEPPAPAPLAPVAVDAAALRDAVDRAVRHQLAWIDANPGGLGNDARIGAHRIHALIGSDDTAALVAKTDRERGESSDPIHRLVEPERQLEARYTTTWDVPAEGRTHVNRVLVEAAYCAENGWREVTTAYVCGPMRDEGGYQTAHGAWALALVERDGCAPEGTTCLADLGEELLAGALRDGRPEATADADLLAERILFGQMAGIDLETLSPYVALLLASQHEDGSFGAPIKDASPYYRYHAAMAGAWALAAWQAAR